VGNYARRVAIDVTATYPFKLLPLETSVPDGGCILVASFVGVVPAALSEIFPAGVRATGTSLVYNGAFTLFGGFAPMILTWFKQQSAGSIYAPAWYVMVVAGLALTAIPLLGAVNNARRVLSPMSLIDKTAALPAIEPHD
jgi:hypothetical protein